MLVLNVVVMLYSEKVSIVRVMWVIVFGLMMWLCDWCIFSSMRLVRMVKG